MNDVEKELKEIQLQRARLALERDISRKATKDRINRVASSIFAAASYLAKRVVGLVLRVARYWKPISLAVFLCAGGVAGYSWWERAEQERYEAAKDAFSEEKCKSLVSSYCENIKDKVSDEDNVHGKFWCMNKSLDHASCKMRAAAEFDKSKNK